MAETLTDLLEQKAQEDEAERTRLLQNASEAPVALPLDVSVQSTKSERRSTAHRGVGDFLSTVAELDFTHRAVARRSDRQDIRDESGYDPTYDINENDLAEVPEEYWDRFHNVGSDEELGWVKDRLLKELDLETNMAGYGMAGMGGRLLFNMIDPISLAVGVSTGGAGWAVKGTRMARVAKTGLLAAGTNVAIEAALASGSPSMDGYDILFAAGAGAILGGGMGAITPKLQRAQNRWRKAAETEEANIYAERLGAEDADTSTEVLTLNDEGELVPNGRASQDEVYGDPDASDPKHAGAAEVTNPGGIDEPAGASILDNGPDAETLSAVPREDSGSNVRWDHANKTLGNENDAVRYYSDGMVMNVVGSREGVVKESATEMQRRLVSTFMGDLYATSEPAYKAWAKNKGYGFMARNKRQTRTEYMNEVGEHIRHGTKSNSAEVQAVVDKGRGFFRDILTAAKKAGVEGFEDIDINDNFMPRFFDHGRINSLNQKHGTGNLNEFLADAMISANRKLDRKDALRIATGYLARVRKLGVGIDSDNMFGMHLGDRSDIEAMLRDADLPTDDIDDLMVRIDRASESKGGEVKHAKRRLLLDESYGDDVGLNGSFDATERLKVSDLFINNFEDAATRYSHNMFGRIGMASRSKIKGEADFTKAKDFIRAHAATKGQSEAAEKGIRSLDQVFDHLMGRNIEGDAADTTKKYARMIRDYNYIRVMNQVGWAQLADLGNIFNSEYGSAALKQMPAFRDIFRSARNGNMTDELAAEMEEVAGTGTDFVFNRMYTRYDEFGHEIGEDGFITGLDHKLQVAKRGVSIASGMAPVNTFMQRVSGKAVAQRLFDMAQGRVALDDAVRRRLRNIGMDDDMAERVFANLRNSKADGTKLKLTGVKQWKDMDARDAFIVAIHRESKRMVQENDISGTFGFQNKTLGKAMTQFRSFVLQAHTRQGVYNWTLRDRHSLTAMMMQSFFGTLAWTAQKGVKIAALTAVGDAAGVDDVLEDLSGWALPKIAIQRAAWSSTIPMLVDSGLYAMGSEVPMFAYRTSGMDTNMITGNPTYDLAVNVMNAARGVNQAVLGGGFDQGDARAILRSLPFQNMSVVGDMVRSGIRETLPKQSRKRSTDLLSELIATTKE